ERLGPVSKGATWISQMRDPDACHRQGGLSAETTGPRAANPADADVWVQTATYLAMHKDAYLTRNAWGDGGTQVRAPLARAVSANRRNLVQHLHPYRPYARSCDAPGSKDWLTYP